MINKKKIILIGGGGHCKSCIDVIEQEGQFEIAGIIDVPEKYGEKILGYPVIGNDENIEELSKKYQNFFITIGQIKSSLLRKKLFEKLKGLKVNIPVIISPRAYVSKNSTIAEGTIIMHFALVNAEAEIGQNCIINTGSIVEHEAKIGNFCHISTNVVINGNCIVGNECLIGSGTILAHGVEVKENCLISSGSVLLRSIINSGTYIGNPLRKIR
ncbi:acetyltransferase [Bacteroidota bacterium]